MNLALEPLPETSGDSDPADTDDELIESASAGASSHLLRLLLLLGGGAVVVSLMYFTPLGALMHDFREIRTFLNGDDLQSEMIFAALVCTLVALGAPRLIFYILGGMVFGLWTGLLLAQLSSVAGSWITFSAIRAGGRGWLEQRFGAHRLLGKALRVRSSVKAVVLIRQLPLTSVMINGGLALSQVKTGVFVAGTFLGYLPQGIVAVMVGSGMVDEQAINGVAQLVGAGVALALAAFALSLWRKKRKALSP